MGKISDDTDKTIITDSQVVPGKQLEYLNRGKDAGGVHLPVW
jgi:hypothetical protein